MNSKIIKNASWIVICKIMQSIVSLIISMFSARYLGPTNYGTLSYAASIVAFVVPLMQLGLRSTLVQELLQKPEYEGETMGTALVLNICSAIVCILGIAAFVIISNRDEVTTIIVCVLYSVNLLFQALEMMQYWFQAKLLSKYTSLISLGAYIIVSIFKIILLIEGKNIYWFAVAQSIDYFIISISQITVYYKKGGSKLCFSYYRGKEMLRKSKHYIVSGMMVMVFQQTDRIMLKNMIGNDVVGYYSAAVVCTAMTGFLFSAIIDSMRPVILENKRDGVIEYKINVSRLFCIIFYVSLCQCIAMTLLAKPIIYILYGVEYYKAVDVLRVVVWYVTYAYLGSVRNVWILAEEKQRYLGIINLIGAITNIVLNLCLIPELGMYGAAIASVITQFFTNFILGFIFSPIKECNKLLLTGMSPSFALKEGKKLVQNYIRH